MPVVVVISKHLLNVFVQLANKRGFKKKKISVRDWVHLRAMVRLERLCKLKTIQ
jgi:hypothetical protein